MQSLAKTAEFKTQELQTEIRRLVELVETQTLRADSECQRANAIELSHTDALRQIQALKALEKLSEQRRKKEVLHITNFVRARWRSFATGMKVLVWIRALWAVLLDSRITAIDFSCAMKAKNLLELGAMEAAQQGLKDQIASLKGQLFEAQEALSRESIKAQVQGSSMSSLQQKLRELQGWGLALHSSKAFVRNCATLPMLCYSGESFVSPFILVLIC